MERMNKLLKRQKRQVSRPKERVRLWDPDVRGPERLRAEREESQPAAGWRNSYANYTRPAIQNDAGAAAGNTTKADGAS
jgi:hypothetical protein